jgi:hypothetical protein
MTATFPDAQELPRDDATEAMAAAAANRWADAFAEMARAAQALRQRRNPRLRRCCATAEREGLR